MVGPIPTSDRETAALHIKLAFSAIIGVSAGLITLQGDVSPTVTGVIAVVGFMFGALVTWFVFPGSGETVRDRPGGRER